jgi:hypothetical protein
MRIIRIAPLLLLFAATATLAADQAAPPATTQPTLQFKIDGKQPGDKTRAELIRLGLELLRTSNFNTVNDPQLLRQSVPVIQDHYRHAAAGDYVLIRYDHPITLKTVGGDVTVYDIFIGLARPDYVSSLFTIDDQCRVVAHEKYSGGVAIEFKKLAAMNGN